MKGFARLYAAIDETNRTSEKVAAMARYFANAPAEDAAWAVHFLIGRRPKRIVSGPKLFAWAAEAAGMPEWLFAECYDAVGDLAEAIALTLPNPRSAPERDGPLGHWVEDRLIPMARMAEAEQREAMLSAWAELDPGERFVWNKLITGAFRVGVSRTLVVRALAEAAALPPATISHRLMGDWTPTAEFFRGLFAPESAGGEASRPYPFALAHPLVGDPDALGDRNEWQVEWKWDGIRAQIVRREGKSYVWSRGEELITDRFPELAGAVERLPNGTVLDGEILAWAGERALPFAELQKRIGRKLLTPRVLREAPAAFLAFDLLELAGEDVRKEPLRARRRELGELLGEANADGGALRLSPVLSEPTWAELAQARSRSRALGVEGLMLKLLSSRYGVGREKGTWWKWKIEPLSVDAVLVYAQPGNGKRASLFTDYTFAVWRQGELTPFAKAYSGLTDEEIREVDAFVRRNTLAKYGPVRTVRPELVMELGFEDIRPSSRHKSGLAVRFPRILRWRRDKRPEDANTLDDVREMLEAARTG